MSEVPLLAPSDLEAFQAGDPTSSLDAAIADLRGRCGWHIAPVRTETLTLAAVKGVVVLPTLRATGAVVVIGGVTLAATDYVLKAGYLVLTGGYAGTTAEVTVTLTHGYDVLPDDLKRVALSAANVGTSPDGRLKSAGPFTYEFADDSDDDVVVGRYRLTGVA